MKYIGILVELICFMAVNAQTMQQQRTAHLAIKSFVAEKYPTAKAKMIVDEYRSYRLVFTMDKHRYNATFSFNGSWVQTQKNIKLAEVPDNVKRSLDTSKYKTGKVYTVLEIISAKRPGTDYIVEVRYDKHDPEVDTYDNIVTEIHKLYFAGSGELAKDELEPDNSLPYIPWGQD